MKVVPNTGLEGLPADAVCSRFILTQFPAGLAGLVLTGLLASAMSTLDANINLGMVTLRGFLPLSDERTEHSHDMMGRRTDVIH